MGRQWIRAAMLTVGGVTITPNWQDASAGVRFKFRVEQATLDKSNRAQIRVYNLSKATSRLPKEGDPVLLMAGYRDNIGTLIRGQVVQALRGKENPVDTFLDVIVGDGDRAFNFGVLNKSFNAGSTGKDVFGAVMQEFAKHGVTPGKVSQLLSSLRYPRGQAIFSMGREVLSTLARTLDSRWFIRNMQVHFVGKDETVGGGVRLGPDSGLIGIPTETLQGIIIRCLINPSLQVGDTVTVDSSLINRMAVTPGINAPITQSLLSPYLGTDDGVYAIDAINWLGDTRGQEWYADLWCHGAVTGSPAQGQVQQGRGGDYVQP